MRAIVNGLVLVSAALLACNQDSASSNAERDTHMGPVRAADLASVESAPGVTSAAEARADASPAPVAAVSPAPAAAMSTRVVAESKKSAP